MTKYERKLMHMLKYYQVEVNGNKDEKMSKKELQKYLDKFNQVLDYYILQDIISKIKDKNKNDGSNPDDESPFSEDYMDGSDDDFEEKDPFFDNIQPEPKKNNKTPNENKTPNTNDPIDADINKFLKWLTLVLYTGDYTVIVNDDGKIINIKLVRLNDKGKK
jgi:hypothetical protein